MYFFGGLDQNTHDAVVAQLPDTVEAGSGTAVPWIIEPRAAAQRRTIIISTLEFRLS